MSNSIALITRDTYQYNNSTVFYALVNNAFMQYYNTVIRKAQQWFDGYDPSFHKSDFVSTRIASKLMNGLANSIYGRGIVFEKGTGNIDKNFKALNFISKQWNEESGFNESVKRLIAYSLGLGTSCLKLSIDSKGNLWCDALRLDYFYYSVDGRKKLNSITMFIRAFQSNENQRRNYVLVEERYFKVVDKSFVAKINNKDFLFKAKERVPYVVYNLYEYNIPTTQNNLASCMVSEKPTNYKNLPDYVKSELKRNYGAYKVGEEQVLPFHESLGVELFFNEGGDITNPSLPFGRSLCFDCLSDFMEFDLNKSFEIRDLYNSKGIVGVPKALSQSDLVVDDERLARNSAYSQMQIEGYELIKGLDPNTQKPIITQFQIRALDHQQITENIMKSLSTTIGVSPRMIATYLATAGQKTDDQIQSEDDSITQWIKSRRKDYIVGLNRVIECVLNYNGFSDNVNVKFANDGLVKGDKQLENIGKRLHLGMLTLDDAIREYYPDLDEDQIKLKIENAYKERAKKIEEKKYLGENNYIPLEEVLGHADES